MTQEEYRQQQAAIKKAQDENQKSYDTIYDELQNSVDQYKAQIETSEQKAARERNEKNAAMFTGIADGIGSIFNLVNATTNPDAVSVAQQPIAVKTAIDEGAVKRNLADEKLKAAQDKLNAIGMQRAASNAQMLGQRMEGLRGDYRFGVQDAYNQAEEQRKQELFPAQKTAAEAQATTAQANATTAQAQAKYADETAQANLKAIQTRNRLYAAQATEAELQCKTQQDLANYYKQNPAEYQKRIEMLAKGTPQEKKTGEDFIIMLGNDPNQQLNLGKVSDDDLAVIIASDPMLNSLATDAIDKAGGKGSQKKPVSEEEKAKIMRRIISVELSTRPEMYQSAISTITQRLGMSDNAANRNGGTGNGNVDAPYLQGQ